MHRTKTAAAVIAALTLTTAVWGQQPIVYPAKGQNPQQQNTDTADCQLWAKHNTGVDPMMVAQQMTNQAPPPQPEQGSGAKSALKGAAVGGIIGGIGGRGGEGAAAGAVVGMMGNRKKQQASQQQYAQQQQQVQQQAAGQLSTFNRAYAACMQGRGYTIM